MHAEVEDVAWLRRLRSQRELACDARTVHGDGHTRGLEHAHEANLEATRACVARGDSELDRIADTDRLQSDALARAPRMHRARDARQRHAPVGGLRPERDGEVLRLEPLRARFKRKQLAKRRCVAGRGHGGHPPRIVEADTAALASARVPEHRVRETDLAACGCGGNQLERLHERSREAHGVEPAEPRGRPTKRAPRVGACGDRHECAARHAREPGRAAEGEIERRAREFVAAIDERAVVAARPPRGKRSVVRCAFADKRAPALDARELELDGPLDGDAVVHPHGAVQELRRSGGPARVDRDDLVGLKDLKRTRKRRSAAVRDRHARASRERHGKAELHRPIGPDGAERVRGGPCRLAEADEMPERHADRGLAVEVALDPELAHRGARLHRVDPDGHAPDDPAALALDESFVTRARRKKRCGELGRERRQRG